MNNWTKSQAEPKGTVSILGFVVLLGMMLNLAWSESDTAGNDTDLNGTLAGGLLPLLGALDHFDSHGGYF